MWLTGYGPCNQSASSFPPSLPQGHDGEVEHIPAISEIGVRMEQKPVSYYLEHGLDGKEDQEGIFELLLGIASSRTHPVRAVPPASASHHTAAASLSPLPHGSPPTASPAEAPGAVLQPSCSRHDTSWLCRGSLVLPRSQGPPPNTRPQYGRLSCWKETGPGASPCRAVPAAS